MTDILRPNQLLAGGSLGKGLLSLFGGISDSNAIKQQTEFSKDQLLLNQQVAEIQSKQAEEVGQFEASVSENRTASIVGEQKVSQASSGIDVNTGTAKQVQEQTAEVGAKDVQEIHNNAAMSAWGFKVKSLNLGSEATQAGLAGNTRANASLFSGESAMFGNTLTAISDLSK